MTELLQINVFDDTTANDLVACSNFHIYLKQQGIEIINAKILEIPWETYQAQISEQIINALRSLKDTDGLDKVKLPKNGLKGIYFCIGYDALSLDICGSLYYNEKDWAANAGFYPEINVETVMKIIEKDLILLNLNKQITKDMICCFMLFTINQSMSGAGNIEEVVNAGIAFGYSDGDELILGKNINGIFTNDIKIIHNGEYEMPSTAPMIEHIPIKTHGEIWAYLIHNYFAVIKSQGLADRFTKGGEEDAIEIAEECGDIIFINRCKICANIKKTPRAKLCLKCGDRSEIKQ